MNLPILILAVLPTIWIVDASNGPGTNFTDLPAAVAAAQNGDTLLVLPGTYRAFHAIGKALTIRGSGAANTMVINPPVPGTFLTETWINSVPPGMTFYVSGMTIHPTTVVPAYPSNGALQLGPGRIVLADVVAQTEFLGGAVSGKPGLFVFAGAEVHASRCVIGGADGSGTALQWAGGPGVLVFGGGEFAADACTITGGNSLGAGWAGDGLWVYPGATATVARSSIYGGATTGSAVRVGADGVTMPPAFVRITGTPADILQGGSTPPIPPTLLWGRAVRVQTGSSAVVHGNPALIGGTSGTAVTLGAVPLPYLSMTGTIDASGEILGNQPVTVTFDGAIPSAPFALLVDLAPTYSSAFAPLTVGELLVPFPSLGLVEGTLDASGMAQTVLVPQLDAPALLGVPLFTQFGVVDAVAGKVRLSNGLIRLLKN